MTGRNGGGRLVRRCSGEDFRVACELLRGWMGWVRRMRGKGRCGV